MMRVIKTSNTSWIYALALGSNFNAQSAITTCLKRLNQLGHCVVSSTHTTRPENDIGADYLNLALLLETQLLPDELKPVLQDIETTMGRIRKSSQVLIDIDVIAYGNTLQQMTLISKRLPLAHYVVTPMQEVWPDFQ